MRAELAYNLKFKILNKYIPIYGCRILTFLGGIILHQSRIPYDWYGVCIRII